MNPVRELLLYSLPSLLDLLALSTVLGVLGCLLWVLPQDDAARRSRVDEAAWARLRRLLGLTLALLTVTGFFLLAARALQMSRQPPGALPDILPTVLLETHYGAVWLVRTATLAALWLGWLGMKRTRRIYLPASMFAATAVIVWTNSATGHAADWGDFTWTEWLHWLHVLSGSLWSGGLMALLLALSPLLVPESASHKAFIAKTMHRLSRAAPFALIAVLATGAFNAAVQLGSFAALRETAYGNILAVKVFLVLAALALWAFNRFAVVPVLRSWLAAFLAPPESQGAMRSPGFRQGGVGTMTLRHRRLMIATAILLVAVLFCAVVLALNMPPRGHATMTHMQHGLQAHGSRI